MGNILLKEINKRTKHEKNFRAENKQAGRGCPECGDGLAEYMILCPTCNWVNPPLAQGTKWAVAE